MDLKAALKPKLTKKQSSLLKASFDIIGSVAILEIPPELEKKEKLIAQTLLKLHKNITTVCKKTSERKGVYRLRKLKVLTGSSTETIHAESGCKFKLDVKKAYFSVRESTERQRILSLVKPKEKILVLFSGIGPYGIEIAKNHPDCNVDMVEINPAACRYAEENIKLNKVSDRVKSYCGDFRKISNSMGKYDRIIMPLPETAYKFLPLALKHANKGCIIHLYGISEEKSLFSDLEAKIKTEKVKVIGKQKTLPYGPRIWKVRVDLMVK